MPITPNIFRYRQDALLDLQMKPIHTQFFSDQNLRGLKAETDKLGVSISESEMLEFMNNAYYFDDEVQKVELNVAIGELAIGPVIQRLNAAVVDEVKRRVLFGGRQFHERFVNTTTAWMGDDYRSLYKGFYDDKLQSGTRYNKTRNARDQAFW